jgi:cytochrome c peroxidase
MTDSEKRGALLFFGKAGCVGCHKVSGASNEMFSDFDMHTIGVPQVAPTKSNVVFDGPGQNEDFGLEQITQLASDRYRFRTSPLRNAALQPAFFHNGAFLSLDAAVRHHLNAVESARSYSAAGLAPDLRGPTGPIEPVLERLDPLISNPPHLVEGEIQDLIAFVRDGLLDQRARSENLRKLIPPRVPSGRATLLFE